MGKSNGKTVIATATTKWTERTEGTEETEGCSSNRNFQKLLSSAISSQTIIAQKKKKNGTIQL